MYSFNIPLKSNNKNNLLLGLDFLCKLKISIENNLEDIPEIHFKN